MNYFSYISILMLSLIILTMLYFEGSVKASSGVTVLYSGDAEKASNQQKPRSPVVKDPTLKVERVSSGLNLSSSMAFEDEGKILVLQKNTGKVLLVTNGIIRPEPLIDVNVATLTERGLTGATLAKTDQNITYVFLCFTESNRDSSDSLGKIKPLGNRVYRYELADDKLVNPRLLLDLPGSGFNPKWTDHNGGRMVTGNDKNLYLQMGDVGRHRTEAENVKDIPALGTGGILRVNFNGTPSSDNPFSNIKSMRHYYAYGIRNGFGMDFDPLTGNLWDTENGDDHGDEVNLVYPGFNSGWYRIQGVWMQKGNFSGNKIYLESRFNQSMYAIAPSTPPGLVDFGGKGKYYPPKFTWNHTVGPTALKFMSSEKLGKDYENDMFVADFHKGNIYHFKLDAQRTNIILNPPLNDKIANSDNELENIVFATGFGPITDLEISPDGYLYLLTYTGEIYRITKRV